ncbi:DUF2953 domain-containing protein [Alkalicoccobacillus porphyridii]|uniref:DUF2953 domain-containing protein n=1 Tax=Alkalicoccobacillus porphyridii TaxID=2597270 RepID=A0A554A2X5_9BACI|nr:DUF2953 domain-containing protein [Alkalicoccobacillus porphyridii]TSB48059.1 DUF2953 domain-containing protein [Alkalicoccobacillus porphyridii]
MIWVWIILGILIILVCIWFIQIKVSVYVAYIHKKQTAKISIHILSFTVYTLNIPVIKTGEKGVVVEEKEKTMNNTNQKKKRLGLVDLLYSYQTVQEWLTFLQRLHKQVKPIFKHIHVHTLEWKTEFGIGDAPLTAQITGYIWTGKSLVIGIISHYAKVLQLPFIQVAPLYQQNLVHTEFSCMFSFRVGQAIHAGITVLRHWRQRPVRHY